MAVDGWYWYGGGPGINASDCYMVDALGERAPGVVATIKDSTTGAVLTDLLDELSAPVTSVSSDALGYLTWAAKSPVVDVSSGTEIFRFVSTTALTDVIDMAVTLAGVTASVATAQATATAAQTAAVAAQTAATAAQGSAAASAAAVADKISLAAATAAFGPRIPDWATGRAFVVGELVVYAGVIYRTVTAHNAGSTFNGSNFLALSSTASSPGGATRTDTIWVDDRPGSTADAKFLDAYNYAKTQQPATGFRIAIRFSNKEYALSTGGLLPYPGMTIWGPEGYNNPERGSAPIGVRLKMSMTGGWFHNTSTSDTFGVSMGNLSFVGGSGASVMTTASGAGTMYCLLMRDISSSGLKTVLGTQAQKLLITAASFDGGAWEINNCYNGAFHLGGSDNTLWPDGMLLDSGTAFNSAGSAAGQYHLWCDYLEKTTIGPLYITCEGNWGGIKVTGPAYNAGGSNNGLVTINGARVEGRNKNAPCNGANIRVEGGMAVLNDCWVSYGMASPSSMGHSPADLGIIHVTSGRLIVKGGVYDRTSGMSETVLWVYLAGGSGRVRDVSIGSNGGVWTGLPRVSAAVVNDDSVQ